MFNLQKYFLAFDKKISLSPAQYKSLKSKKRANCEKHGYAVE